MAPSPLSRGRRAGATHTLVFQFDSTISVPGALTVVDDGGVLIGSAMASAADMEVTVDLPGLADSKRIRVSLTNVNGAGVDVSASLGFRVGDTTNIGAITPNSITAIKARAGQVVDASNFKYDINASGVISAADVTTVKARNGGVLLPGPPWLSFARNAQHTALSTIASQPLTRLRWSTPVDLAPQYSGGTYLLAHYGPPVITARNTVLLPVKVGAFGGFRFEARSGANGAQVWSLPSDYILPPHRWLPSYNLTLTTTNRVYAPGSGGKILYRDNVDSPAGTLQSFVFYGASAYAANPSAFDSTVFINTPITADAQGNVFFGFVVTGGNPANLTSGIARVAADGTATSINAAALLGTAIAVPNMNSAPALSLDQRTLYVGIRTSPASPGTGCLVALDSTTLAINSSAPLLDPRTGTNAVVIDDGTSSPTVGPDGDVYFGVLGASGGGHESRGWMLHFDAALATVKTPGAFGWDNTASIVPASMVPSYTGASAYLLMTKYNSYADGQHRIAILDPNQSQIDSNGVTLVMNEVLTKLGVTPDPYYPYALTEWCINTAAVDPITRSVLVNSEDSYLYRWSLVTNQLVERIQLNSGIGQAYTPTVIGPDGTVYAVNNGVLFSVSR